MEFWTWLLAVPLLLLVLVLSKGLVLAFHPTNRKPLSSVTPDEREYSAEALRSMACVHIEKENVEKVIRSGTKTTRYRGSKYRYTNAEGRTIVVFTDSQGNVESVGA